MTTMFKSEASTVNTPKLMMASLTSPIEEDSAEVRSIWFKICIMESKL